MQGPLYLNATSPKGANRNLCPYLGPFGSESLDAHPVEVVAFLVLGPDRTIWDMHIFRQQIGFGSSVQKLDIVIGKSTRFRSI
jgi:hypothetical protein